MSTITCPLHWPEQQHCGPACMKVRKEFRRVSEALRIYWKERAEGKRPTWGGWHAKNIA